MHHVVIGGTGFIGGHLVEHLIERGGQVRVLARRPERPAWLPAAAELQSADLSQPSSLAGQLQSADLVYVTAPLPPVVGSEAAVAEALHASLHELVRACQRVRVSRLIYLSNVDLYAERLPSRPITEDYPTRPASTVGRLRLAAEQALQTAAGACRLPLVILRPVTAFGPRDHSFTRPLLDAYSYAPGPSLVGGGRARLSLVYVKDVARTLALAARHPHAPGQTFHVGGFATTWRAFIAALCAELDVPPPPPGLPYSLAYLLAWCAERLAPAGRPVQRRRAVALVGQTRLYSDAHLVRSLVYRPTYDLLAGAREVVTWYRGLGRSRRPASPGPTIIPLPQSR
jgi:nucleoside-diphosphate-sugar epimerase